jgi:hypothetical protein
VTREKLRAKRYSHVCSRRRYPKPCTVSIASL